MATQTMAHNAAGLRERVRIAAERAHRDPDSITIVAVSKTFAREQMDEAYELGFRVFGESRVQEIRQKCAMPFPHDAEIHMIGPLQTNKVRQILPHIHLLETLDRHNLFQSLNRELEQTQRVLPVMIQVNVSGEVQKSGLPSDDVSGFFPAVLESAWLRPTGLMTMAPLGADEPTLHRVFGGLRELRDQLEQQFGIGLPSLSMGMSSDFETAIAEGATHVRIGRALFGDR